MMPSLQDRVLSYVREKEAKAAEHAALTMFANERREQRVSSAFYAFLRFALLWSSVPLLFDHRLYCLDHSLDHSESSLCCYGTASCNTKSQSNCYLKC